MKQHFRVEFRNSVWNSLPDHVVKMEFPELVYVSEQRKLMWSQNFCQGVWYIFPRYGQKDRGMLVLTTRSASLIVDIMFTVFP